MKKQQFNVNTAGLTAYVDESQKELLYQLNMVSDLAPYAEVHTGLKGTQRVHFINTSVTFQSDSCSYNASDSTPFTEKDLTVEPIAIMEDICVKALNGFWTQQLVAAGGKGEEVIPSEISRAWMDIKMNVLKKEINTADWQGDTSSGTANLNKYDGLIKKIAAASGVIVGNTSLATTATTVSNILARMQEMYLAIPEDLRNGAPDGGNLIWFLPQSYFDMYTMAGRAANYFHYKIDEGTAPTYFGTNIQLVPQVGLAGTNKMYITPKNNILLGMDAQSEEDQIDVWYSKDDRINHSLITFKRGLEIKFYDYVVRWDLSGS